MSDELIRRYDVLGKAQWIGSPATWDDPWPEGKEAVTVEDIEAVPTVDAVEVDRERLLSILRSYFNIGDSYTFELTRVKEAFEVGTMTFDDFEEWGENNIADLCDYIIKHCGARMDGCREE